MLRDNKRYPTVGDAQHELTNSLIPNSWIEYVFYKILDINFEHKEMRFKLQVGNWTPVNDQQLVINY